MLKFLLSYIKPYKKQAILGSFLIFLTSILIIPTPFITKFIIDIVLPSKDIRQLIFMVILLLVTMIISSMTSYYKSVIFMKTNNRIVFNIRKDLLNKVQRVSILKYNTFGVGYLIGRIKEDTMRINSLFADVYAGILKDFFTLLFGLIAIFVIHWKLALLSCLLMPLYIYLSIVYSRLIKKHSTKYFESESNSTQQLSECLNSISLIKVFSRYKFNIIRYVSKAKIAYRNIIKLSKISFQNSLILGILTQIIPIIAIAYGGYEIIFGRLTVGELIAFNSLVVYIYGPTSRIIAINAQIQQSIVALKRLYEIFSLETESIDRNYLSLINIDKFELKGISFSYNHDNDYVLKNINVSVRKGEKVGIIGHSGSGKTTLLQIISGIYAPSEGQITVNDEELPQYQMESYRKHLAVVDQSPIMFHDTIYKNIIFGNPKATLEEVVLAAKLANAHEFILELENGYDTVIDKMGNGLSVGQKQRIAIARALIRKPKILILDEITSSIDSISEKEITHTIHTLPNNIMVFIVSHRLNIIKDCDLIISLYNGSIIETGTHNELIGRKGYYSELVNSGRLIV